MRAEPNPQWARSVERSRRALKHSAGLWNPSPHVGSRRPDATHSPRHPRLLDTRRVPLPTPQTTTCLTFRTPIGHFWELYQPRLSDCNQRGLNAEFKGVGRMANYNHRRGIRIISVTGKSGSIPVCSSQRPTLLARPVLGTWGTTLPILGDSAENRPCV